MGTPSVGDMVPLVTTPHASALAGPEERVAVADDAAPAAPRGRRAARSTPRAAHCLECGPADEVARLVEA